MLVVVVGCFGLASNIIGLFLFHGTYIWASCVSLLTPHSEHGHTHDHGHDHTHSSGEISGRPQEHGIIRETTGNKTPSISVVNGEREPLLINGSTTPIGSPINTILSPGRHGRSNSIDSISLFGHPIQNRQYIISKAEDMATNTGLSTSPPPSPHLQRHTSFNRSLSLHRRSASASNNFNRAAIPESEDGHDHSHSHSAVIDQSPASGTPIHKHPHQGSYDEELGKQSGHHHHGSMNMRALLLHVFGDALGNVGVISSGLIIWKTTWWWKYYSDPMISLLITIIIFSSALPLVKSASFILLQGK